MPRYFKYMPADPLPSQAVGDVWQPHGHQHIEVSQGQADQVAIGGCVHVPRGQHHQDRHGIAHNARHAH